VERHGRITHGCMGLYSDDNEAALTRVIAHCRRAGTAKFGIQIAHAGRKASSQRPWEGGALIPLTEGGWTTVAPSAVPHADGEAAPAELDAAGLARAVGAFADAAHRAERIGIDALELHMAHGYLLHQFLSPLANRRADAYGGSFDNRVRFPLEVFAAVRAAWPAARPLGVRVSAVDWVDGGWALEETIELAQRLKTHGADWIDVSSGGVSPQQKIPLGPGYQVPLAREIRRATAMATIAVGLITEPNQANRIIASGAADLVALARGMLWNPRWPWHAAAALGRAVQAPKPYWRAPPREAAGAFADARIRQR
jgi:2,4-dienoyl-CoA reductase-like NADH-dependent reductase (Old Yellow Enzyme family)